MSPAIWPVAQNLLISFSRYQNTPAQFVIARGDKCADMQYFTLDEVANLKNVVSTTRISLAGLAKGEIYSECKSYNDKNIV